MRGGAVMVTGFLWLRFNLFLSAAQFGAIIEPPNTSVMKCTNGTDVSGMHLSVVSAPAYYCPRRWRLNKQYIDRVVAP